MGLSDRRIRKLSKEQFARLMLDALRQAGEKADLRYEADEFRLVATGERAGEVGIFNLTNAYGEYCAAGKDKKHTVLRRFVRSWFSRFKDIPEDFADARPDLLPVIRSRSYFELLRLRLEVEDKVRLNSPHRIIGEHFGLGLAYDLPEAMRIISQDHLDGWKVAFEDVLQGAMTNLTEISRQAFENPFPGVWVSPWRDNYDAARLLLPDLLRDQAVEGDLIAFAPNRDTLILTGSDDAAGLARMVDLAEEAFQPPRPLLGLALRLEGDEWQPYLPPADHPLHSRFKRLWVQSMSHDYHDQKELLDKGFEKKGEDVFVGSFVVIQHKDTGRVRSYSVWSEGIDTLLPKTDLVFFVGPKPGQDDPGIVAEGQWDRVCQVVGHLMERTDFYPERYRVKEFPSQEQLAAIVKGA